MPPSIFSSSAAISRSKGRGKRVTAVPPPSQTSQTLDTAKEQSQVLQPTTPPQEEKTPSPEKSQSHSPAQSPPDPGPTIKSTESSPTESSPAQAPNVFDFLEPDNSDNSDKEDALGDPQSVDDSEEDDSEDDGSRDSGNSQNWRSDDYYPREHTAYSRDSYRSRDLEGFFHTRKDSVLSQENILSLVDENGKCDVHDVQPARSSTRAQGRIPEQRTTRSTRRRHPNSPRFNARRDSFPVRTPSLVHSLASKTSSDVPQPPTPPDTSPELHPLQLSRNVLSKEQHPGSSLPETDNVAPPPTEAASSVLSERPQSWNVSAPAIYYPPPPSSQDCASVCSLPTPPSPPSNPAMMEAYPHQRGGRKMSKRPKRHSIHSGYGYLASHLASSAAEENNQTRLPPLYRRFEGLNNRILLHLQDEIAQMEEELQLLDEYEELQRMNIADQQHIKALPASRRGEVRSHFHSPLHYRRLQLMEVLIYKTEQYSKLNSACTFF